MKQSLLVVAVFISIFTHAETFVLKNTNVQVFFNAKTAEIFKIAVKPIPQSNFIKMCDGANVEIITAMPKWAKQERLSAGRLVKSDTNSSPKSWIFEYEVAERPKWRLTYKFSVKKKVLTWDILLRNPGREVIGTDINVCFKNLYVNFRKEFNTNSLFPNGYTKLKYRADYIGEFPMTSILDERANLGLTINSSFGVMRPLFSIEYDKKSPKRSVVFKNQYIGTGDGITARVSLDLFGHSGDWRPGMGLIFDNYPGYFSTKSQTIRKHEGNFLCAWYFSDFSDKYLDDLVNLRMITNCEIMFYHPYYGVYAPDVGNDESWTIRLLEKERLEDIRKMPERQTTYNEINALIERMRKHKVGSFIYYNYIDGSRHMPDLKKRFGDQIFINAENRMKRGELNGESLGNDRMYVMQMEPGTPWANYMEEQAKKLLKRIPGCDGYFIDMVNGYGVYDRNHSDGITVINGKKAYYDAIGIARMQEYLMKKLWEPNNKGIWANGPKFPEISKSCDALIAEIPGWTVPERDPGVPLVSFLCLDKPFVYMLASWRKDNKPPQAKHTERHLKYGLLYGGFVDALIPMQGDLKMKAFKAYLPLFKAMRGRKWVFEAHPITIPKPLYGNIFSYKDNSYTVYIFDRKSSILNPPAKVFNDIKIEVKVANLDKVKKVVFTSVTDPEASVDVPFKYRNGKIYIIIKKFSVAGMLRLIP